MEFCGMKREIDRKCLNHARVHANAQSFDRCETSGQVQRHFGFEWLCKHNRLRSELIRFVRLDSKHAQSDGKPVNHTDFRCWTRPEVAILIADQKEQGILGRE